LEKQDFFTSRWGLILSALGISIGTGNIWRFSRIVAQNGGGSFLIPWVIFLFIWSVPLIITEFALGKNSRKGPIGSFIKTAGSKYGWMGGWIAFVSTAIMFYYAVITGWCFYYLYSTVSGSLLSTPDHLQFWNQFSTSSLPVFFNFIALAVASVVVFRGVSNGIEKVNKVLISFLFIIIIILLVRAVSLPGAIEGLKYFFTPKAEYLLDYKVWLNALTQNAWDTGAGWGLIMTYAVYMKKQEDISINAAIMGFGNNSVSLMAGMIIFSTVFALGSGDPLSQISQSGPANTGLTLIYLPKLFSNLSDSYSVNYFFTTIFFLALSFAALTSLISMVELASKSISDFGINKKKAIIIVSIIGFAFGIPSALDIRFLLNQDWVWGMALILSGAFISFAVIKYGVNKFRVELINGEGSDIKIGKWYNFIIKYLIPIQAIVLIIWWLSSSISWDKEFLNPFHSENFATCVFQWTIVLVSLFLLNKKLNKSFINE
jgi:NSS family neurotransmitter:Na+ symporter